MNSILILNKENFYSQMNEVLEIKNEQLAVQEFEEEEVENHSEVKEHIDQPVKNIIFEYHGGIQDDPF